jgi:hypothetical protein
MKGHTILIVLLNGKLIFIFFKLKFSIKNF